MFNFKKKKFVKKKFILLILTFLLFFGKVSANEKNILYDNISKKFFLKENQNLLKLNISKDNNYFFYDTKIFVKKKSHDYNFDILKENENYFYDINVIDFIVAQDFSLAPASEYLSKNNFLYYIFFNSKNNFFKKNYFEPNILKLPQELKKKNINYYIKKLNPFTQTDWFYEKSNDRFVIQKKTKIEVNKKNLTFFFNTKFNNNIDQINIKYKKKNLTFFKKLNLIENYSYNFYNFNLPFKAKANISKNYIVANFNFQEPIIIEEIIIFTKNKNLQDFEGLELKYYNTNNNFVILNDKENLFINYYSVKDNLKFSKDIFKKVFKINLVNFYENQYHLLNDNNLKYYNFKNIHELLDTYKKKQIDILFISFKSNENFSKKFKISDYYLFNITLFFIFWFCLIKNYQYKIEIRPNIENLIFKLINFFIIMILVFSIIGNLNLLTIVSGYLLFILFFLIIVVLKLKKSL
jgi:hypothetical protein